MTTTLSKEQLIQQFANQSPCLCFNLRKASRAITQVYDHLLREIQMTSSQISIINALKIIGAMKVSEISEAMATDRTTIARNLKPLEQKGYIEIQPGKDRRSREITLTTKGETISEKSFEIFDVIKLNLYGRIGENRVEKVCKELNDIVDIIQKD